MSKAVSPGLLEILRCPEDHTRLKSAGAELVARCNQAITNKTLRNRAGTAVTAQLEAGLVREDGQYMYPVVDGIPIMLVDEAIPLSQSM